MVVAFEQRRLPFLRSSAGWSPPPKHETSSPPQGSLPLALPRGLASRSNDMAGAASLSASLRLGEAIDGRRLLLRRRHLVEQLAHPAVRHRRQRHARRLAGAAEPAVEAAPVRVVA